MISGSAEDLNATELLCSFILHAAGATLVAIRRSPGHDPVVVFKAKNVGPEHAISLFELTQMSISEALSSGDKPNYTVCGASLLSKTLKQPPCQSMS